MQIFRQNVRGLLCNKDYLLELIDYFKKVQIFAVTETHVNKDLNNGSLFEIPGFDFASKLRQNHSGGGGGIGIYIQNHLIWNRLTDLESDEIEGIAAEITPEKAKSFYIFVIYRPPDSSKFLHPKFSVVFHNLLSQLSLKECILLGDSPIANLNQYYNSLVSNN